MAQNWSLKLNWWSKLSFKCSFLWNQNKHSSSGNRYRVEGTLNNITEVLKIYQFQSWMHVFNILWNETAQLQEIFFTKSWLLFFTLCAFQFTGKATSKILINNRPVFMQSKLSNMNQFKLNNWVWCYVNRCDWPLPDLGGSFCCSIRRISVQHSLASWEKILENVRFEYKENNSRRCAETCCW